jgi:F-type H+-transporting ATPase subunit gamma
MAVDLQKLKRKMRGVTSTRQVTRALQMVSAMKMRKAQDQSAASRAYREALVDLMKTFDASPGQAVPDLAVTPSGNKVLVAVFASDRGLCGPYNTNVLNAVARLAREIGHENLEIKAVGWKVGTTLRRRGFNILSCERRPGTTADWDSFLVNFSRELLAAWGTGEYARIGLLYSGLRGLTVLKPELENWLPLSGSDTGAGADRVPPSSNYIDEPGATQVLAEAIRRFLNNELLSARLHSEASEHVARMMAMDNATRNAEEMFHSLQLTFNKARQAKITQEICEIVSGANAI